MPRGYNERLCLVGEPREPNEAGPRPSLDSTQVVHSCMICGALVRDTAVHDRWHSREMLVSESMNQAIDRLEQKEE